MRFLYICQAFIVLKLLDRKDAPCYNSGMNHFTRSAGVLLPLFSLPSQSGIGTLGSEAYRFVDFLKQAGQTYWQILPLGPVSYGDSPYASPSAFAGNPYFIDVEDGYSESASSKQSYIDYGHLYETKLSDLKRLYKKFRNHDALAKFRKENADWLDDYCLFAVLKAQDPQTTWLDWDEPVKRRDVKTIAELTKSNAEEIQFHAFVQYEFFRAWNALKEYANKNGIRIIGDIPIYTSLDSADVWANPELFELDKSLHPVRVAGCPPDAFSPLGQRWGNPLYNWTAHKQSGYAWWLKRIGHSLKLYDCLRIDHFRGFESYFAIPAADKTAQKGEWVKGPDQDFIGVLNGWFNNPPIIAEDLGYLTEAVRDLLKFSGYPGMRVLQFGFGSPIGVSEHLPHHYPYNCVAYTGTHDNDTACGYFKTARPRERAIMKEYLGVSNGKLAGTAFARAVLQSTASIAIVSFSDYLNEGSEARINIPSTPQNNWRVRFTAEAFSDALAAKIKRMTELSARLPK